MELVRVIERRAVERTGMRTLSHWREPPSARWLVRLRLLPILLLVLALVVWVPILVEVLG